MTLSLKYILIALFFKSKGAVLRRNWEVGGKKANSQQAACLSLTKETRRPHGRLVIALPKWTSRRLLWAQIYGMANISRLQASQAHCWTCCRTAAGLQWASSYFAAVSSALVFEFLRQLRHPCILAISILAVWLLAVISWVLFFQYGLHVVFSEHSISSISL